MIEVVKYSSVNDFGTVVNPMIVEGQLHGGVVQGIGQALMEMTVYDEDGQLLTGSYMDYALPRASDAPMIRGRQPSGAGQDQSARRQGLRRGRLRRRADVDHERGGRRAVGIRHPPHRHAGDAASGLAGDPRRQAPSSASDDNEQGCAMTQTVDLPLPSTRAGENKLVGGVCFAHFVSHYYIMLLAPLFVFVREDYGVSYTELGLALHRLQRGLDHGADADRLPGRPRQRAPAC